jgi:hypothetical protein
LEGTRAPNKAIIEDEGGSVRMYLMGASESALLDHAIAVCQAIERGEAEYRHEDVALHYLCMFDKERRSDG